MFNVYGFNRIPFNRQVQKAIAEINISSITKYKLSDEAGMTVSTVTFTVSESITGWEARATYYTQTPGKGIGTVVGSGGNVAKNATTSFDVTFDELSNGDGAYIVTIYQL